MQETSSILLSRSDIQKLLGLKGLIGKLAASIAYRVLELDTVNATFAPQREKQGPEFSAGILEEIGIGVDFNPAQLKYIPAEGGFFTVSNHHYGAADGLILSSIIGSHRKDLRILTTFFLSLIPNLRQTFIPVDNFSSGGARSVSGIRTALEHISSGGALSLFPAGEVATWQHREHIVEDKPWADNMMKLILRSGLPVVPVYFDGENSASFHRLGRIYPMLRTIRLPHELFNKRGKTIKVRMGRAIEPQEFAGLDAKSLGTYLRNRCYALGAQCEAAVPAAARKEALAQPQPAALVAEQVEALGEDKLLFESGDYRLYLVSASDAPAAMREIYRLREETFRAIGEGTGSAEDTDKYDLSYSHLILWNVPGREIAGAFRIGDRQPFYTADLVKYGAGSAEILGKSLELGRSFIALKYQKDVQSLKLLLSGINASVLHYPDSEYFVGTVTISNSVPQLLKSLIVKFVSEHFAMPGAEAIAAPSHPFSSDFGKVDADGLLMQCGGDLDNFDKLLANLSDGSCRIPVLMKRYLKCGAKVVCFNVDPDFSDCLDGLFVHRFADFPKEAIAPFVRVLPEDMRLALYKRFYGDSYED